MLIQSTILPKYLVKIVPIYLVFGQELFLVEEALGSIREFVFNFGFTQRKIIYIETNVDWRFLTTLQTGSLFDAGQLLEIRVLCKINKDGIDVIENIIRTRTPEATNIYLFVFFSLDKLVTNAAWLQSFIKVGLVVRVDNVSYEKLGSWISDRLAKQDQYLINDESGSRALKCFVENVEGNLLAAHQEILKLSLLYPKGQLTEENILEAIMPVARYDVFKFKQVLFINNLEKLIQILHCLRQEGVMPSFVLWAIAEELRCFEQILYSINQGESFLSVASRYRLWGKKMQAYKCMVKKVSIRNIALIMKFVFFIDCQIKGVLNLSEYDLFSLPIIIGNDAWESIINLLQYLLYYL